jgi:Glycosyltransferases involved in cell wall biogenesis
MITNSIIMPVYNNEAYVSESLSAFMHLDPSCTEIIIVDDCSTDRSIAIINSIVGDRPNTRLIKNSRNLGAARALKEGIKESRGKYLYCAAADDISSLSRIERCEAIFDSNPKVGIIVSNATVINEKSRVTGETYAIDSFVTNDNIAINQFKRNYCLGATMAIRSNKEILLKEGMLEESDDYQISLEYLLSDFDIHIIREELVRYRIHSTNLSGDYLENFRKTQKMTLQYDVEEIKSLLLNKGFQEKEVYVSSGIFELFRGNLEQGYKFLKLANDIKSANSAVAYENLFYLGVCSYLYHDLDSCIDYFESAYSIHSEEPTVQNNLGVCYLESNGDVSKSLAWIENSLLIEPNYIDALNNRDQLITHENEKRMKLTQRILSQKILKRPTNYLG